MALARRYLILVFLAVSAAAHAADYSVPGEFETVVELGEFEDTARDRKIPYKLYRPEILESVHPLIIFSHGLGGSRDAAAYLGEHFATHGFIALHIQHPGTDRTIFEGARRPSKIKEQASEAIKNPQNAINRFQDVPFVLDQIEIWNREGALAGHIDLDAIGMSGHSFGAKSTLVAAGELIGNGSVSFKDERLTAAIAYSPNMPQKGDPQALFSAIDIPLMHVTGTKDDSPLERKGDFDPAIRTKPFEHITATPQYLLVLDGAQHSAFGGRKRRRGGGDDAQYWPITKATSLAFWKATLKDDAEALAYLNSRTLAEDPLVARFDFKN